MKRLFILLLASLVIGCTATGNDKKVVTKVWPNIMFEEEEFLPWDTFNGRVRRITKKTGDRISTYSYDMNGRLEEITCHDNFSNDTTVITYNYDETGRKQAVYYHSHGNPDIEIIDEDGEIYHSEEYTSSAKTLFKYDKEGILSQDSSYVNNYFDSTTSYEYDRSGRVIKKIEHNRYYETFSTTYEYDKHGRVIEKNKEGHIKNYRYDDRDNLMSITDNYDGTTSFTYDDHGHITMKQDDDGLTEYRYEYDSYGNPVQIIETYNSSIPYLTEQHIEYYE